MDIVELMVLLPVSRLDFLRECLASVDEAILFSQLRGTIVIIDTSIQSSVNEEYILGLGIKSNIIILRQPGSGYGDALRSVRIDNDAIYVALMNDDDVCEKSRFKECHIFIEENRLDAVHTLMQSFGINERKIRFNLYPRRHYSSFSLFFGPYGANATLFAKSSWWCQHILLTQEVGEPFDWKFALKSYFGSEVGLVPKVLYMYRQHQMQITRSQNYRKNLVQNMLPFLLNTYPDGENLRNPEALIRLIAFPYDLESKERIYLTDFIRFVRKMWPHFSQNRMWFIYHCNLRLAILVAKMAGL